jgi:hypothetical protein
MDTDELKKLMAAATPEPWEAEEYSVNAATVDRFGNPRKTITQGGCGCCNDEADGVWRKEDARFIAAVHYLAREVIALRAALAAAEAEARRLDEILDGYVEADR